MRPTSGPRHLDSPTRSRSLLALAAAACFLLPLASAPYAEAAQVLDVPVGTVMSRLHRARASVRDRLDRAGLAPRSH